MESSNVPEPNKENLESSNIPEAQIPPEIWKDLLHTAIIGNGIFPQAFFAQGILLAYKTANLVKEGRLSLTDFQREDPPRELTNSMLEDAKIKSHRAYGFKSTSSMVSGGVANVWGSDKNHAINTLNNFSELIYNTNPNNSQEAKDKIKKTQKTHIVLSDPKQLSLLQELLGIARESLMSPEVKEISNNYKKDLGHFMQKYSEFTFSNVPSGYDDDRKTISESLSHRINEAVSNMKGKLASQMELKHPDKVDLLQGLKDIDSEKLFGSIESYSPHPLKHPDYE